MIKTFDFIGDKMIFILLTEIVKSKWFSPQYIFKKRVLRRCSQKSFGNVIGANTEAYTSSIILKIRYRSFLIYLIIDRAIKVVLEAKIVRLNNTGGSKISSRSSNGEINRKEVELGRFHTELGL